MPHLLIAGATGSGKSVCINTIIMSILYKARPDEVKLIMIDPKVVELSVYNGIPHLMIPVVTDPKKASGALHWAVAEMTERYEKFAEANVREINGYNAKVDSIEVPEGQERPQKMPQIVIIVDELADLMMVASNDVEEAICRLAQLARAAGDYQVGVLHRCRHGVAFRILCRHQLLIHRDAAAGIVAEGYKIHRALPQRAVVLGLCVQLHPGALHPLFSPHG